MTQMILTGNLLAMLTPVFSGLFCIVLVFLRFPVWEKTKGSGIRPVMLAFYLLTAFNWLSGIVPVFCPRTFVYIKYFTAATVMYIPITLYHLIYILTRQAASGKFSPIHYVLPGVVFIAFLAWPLLGPSGNISRVPVPGMTPPGYEDFYVLVSLAVLMRFLFGTVYSALSVSRYLRYRRYIAEYSSDLYTSSLYWLRVFLILWVSFLAIPVFALVLPVEMSMTPLLIVPACLLFLQHLLLCFNILRENYVYMEGAGDWREESVAGEGHESKRHVIVRKTFQKYIQDNKPYLNSRLTISDMSGDLGTNRSYLSAFINRTYGMNFSQLVNEYRLRELDLIMADPESARRSNIDNISAAGFGSYKSYLRAMKMHEKRKILSAND